MLRINLCPEKEENDPWIMRYGNSYVPYKIVIHIIPRHKGIQCNRIQITVRTCYTSKPFYHLYKVKEVEVRKEN